jgi:hypothetical protein
MMERDRKREGLRVCGAAWLIGVQRPRVSRDRGRRPHAEPGDVPADLRAVRVAETFVASPLGDAYPSYVEWTRMVDVFEWPRSFG